MDETGAGVRSRIIKSARYAAVCLGLWTIWKGWTYLRPTSVPAYEHARAEEMFRGAVDIFPKTSTAEVRLIRFRYFDKSFMWANHILVARFEGVDTRFVDDLRKRYCTEAAPEEYNPEWHEEQSKKKWDRYIPAVLPIRDRSPDRRKDFEYCRVSYKELPGANHTETVIWLEKGGRTAILYGEFYSG